MYTWLQFIFLCVLLVLVPPPVTRFQWVAFVVAVVLLVLKRSDGIEQGFITSRNRYVDRKEGLALQKAAGIESVAEGGYRGGLFSEDLY